MFPSDGAPVSLLRLYTQFTRGCNALSLSGSQCLWAHKISNLTCFSIGSPRFARHLNPPGHPERIERAHVLDTVASRRLLRGGRVTSPPRPATARRAPGASTRQRTSSGSLSTAGKASCSMPTLSRRRIPYDIALLAAGATIQAAEHAIRSERPHSRWYVRRDITRNPIGRWVSACSTMSRLRRSDARARSRAHRDRRHRRAPRQRDARNLLWRSACFTCRLTSSRSTQGPARRMKLGRARGEALPSMCRWRQVRLTRTTRWSTVTLSDLCSRRFVRARACIGGYDAHERDPLASMRMTVAGYAAVVGSLRDVAIRHGALALVTEGGYDLTALGACLEASIAVLEGTCRRRLEPTRCSRGARAAR